MPKYKRPNRFVHFLLTHDYSKLFFITYLLLSVGLSIIFNLGFFVLLAVMHYCMDIFKYRHGGLDYKTSLVASLRDCMVDVMFIFIGYASAIVFQVGFGMGIARSIVAEERLLVSLRAEEQILVKSLKTIKLLPKIFIGERAIEATSYMLTASNQRKRGKPGKFQHKPLNHFEKIMIAISAVCVVFFFAAPSIYDITLLDVLHIIVKESIPTLESHFF